MGRILSRFLILRSYLSIYLSIKNSLTPLFSFSKYFIKFSVIFLFYISFLSNSYSINRNCEQQIGKTCTYNRSTQECECKSTKDDLLPPNKECEWPDGSQCFQLTEGDCDCRCVVSNCEECYGNANHCTRCKFGYKGLEPHIVKGTNGYRNCCPENDNCSVYSLFCNCETCIYCYDKNNEGKCVPKKITIKFDKDGGNGGTPSAEAIYGSSLPKITLPIKIGYDFAGYYTQKNITFENAHQYCYYDSKGNAYITSPKTCGISGVINLFAAWISRFYDCPIGKYISKNSDNCEICKKGYYCPGIKARFNGNDQGIYRCPENTTSDIGATSEGQCYTECKPKEYLPKNEITCETCKKGYLCKGGKFYKKDYNQGIEFCSNGEYLNNDASCHSCSELYTEGKYNNKDNLNGYISHNLNFKSNEIKTQYSSKEELNKDNEETNNNYCTPNYDYTKCSIDAKKSCYIKSKSTVNKQFIDSEETLEIIGDCSYDNLNINIDISIKNCNNECKGQLDLTPECEDCINQCKSECKERYSNEYHNDCNKKCDDYDPSRLPGLA